MKGIKNQRVLLVITLFFMLSDINLSALYPGETYEGKTDTELETIIGTGTPEEQEAAMQEIHNRYPGTSGSGDSEDSGNNNESSSNTSNTGNSNSDNNGGSSSPSTPPTPPPKTYPDPKDSMDDDELREIADCGTTDQRIEAHRLLNKHEHERVNNSLVQKKTDIEEQTDLIIQNAEYIPQPAQNSPLPEGKNQLAEEKKDEVTAKNQEIEKTLPENTIVSEKAKNVENSDEGGDPVQITEGSYVQNETDFEFTGPASFAIKRKYVSSNKIISSFGYGWITNLDERIILGTDVSPEEHRQNLEDYSLSIKKIIEDYENELAQAYDVSNIYNANSIFNERIIALNDLINAASIKLLETETLLGFAEGYEAAEEIEELRIKTNDFIEEQTARRDRYAAIMREIDRHLECLKMYKEQYEESLRMLDEYQQIYLPSMMRKERNRCAVFSGMEKWYEETGLDTVTLIDEQGYPHIFRESGRNSGVWINVDEKRFEKIRSTGAKLELLMYDGTVKLFDDKGFLIRIIDRCGNYVSINRLVDEKIDFIETSDSEKLEFEYKGNYISKITNVRSSDENVVYGYKGNKLETVKDTDGDSVTMKYDSDGRMTALVKCDGSEVSFTYKEMDSDGNVLTTSTTNEEGASEYFRYDRINKCTEYTDHDGNRTTYWYDEKNRTVREVQADGTQIITDYNDPAHTVTVRTNGASTIYTYDEKDNLLRVEYPDGSYERWTYDGNNLIDMHIDRDGVQERFVRDGRGNVREYVINGKKVLRQDVDSKGLVRSRTLYGQHEVTTVYDYDDYGNIRSESCGGVTTVYEYDERNRIKKVSVNTKPIIEYKYEGRKTIRKDWGGLVTTYLTNGRKDITEVIQQDSDTEVIHKTRIEYDKRHLPLRVYTGDGTNEKFTASYLYTAEGKIRAEVLHGNENWIKLYEYKYGEISEVKQFKTASPVFAQNAVVEPVETTLQRLLQSAGENVYIQKYNRKQLGNNELRITVTDGLGIQNLFEYDSFGNLVKQTDGNGEVTESRFRNGILREEQDSFGGWYEYGYTDGIMTKAGEKGAKALETKYYPDGSINYTVDRYGKKTFYNYDSRGRVTSLQNENQKIWYEYDIYDRVTKELIGNSNNESSAAYFVAYEYSEDNRSVIVTEGGKYKTLYELDAFGNVLKETDGNGNTKCFVYDCQNQLVAEYNGYGNKTSYEYNALGQVRRVTLPDGAASDYLYNHMGLPEKITDDCGTVYTAVYDKAGRLKKERNRAESERTYEYDNGGRITKIICGGEVVESYSYSNNGCVVTTKDGNGNDYLYNYDSFGRLKNEKNRLGLTQQYFYDDDGQLKTQSSFDGSTITVNYLQNRTIRTVKYSDGTENHFIYDMMGNITEAENAYGKIIYQYDKGGHLTYQKDVITGEEIRFEYDDAGNRTRLYSSNRETKYLYGKNNEVTEIFDNKQRLNVKLEYNKNGQETVRKFGNGTKEETLYDKAGRVIVKLQKSESGDLQWAEGYVYGDDGKRTATVDSRGLVTIYDYNNKGQIQGVYYPYSQELINNLKKEAEENGLPTNIDIGENQYLNSDLRSKIVPLLNAMQYGLAYNLPNMQSFIKEIYAYDGNGNRIAKTMKYGTICYSYDKENRLISSGARGKAFINYTYDNAGNLLTEESANKLTKYAYNAQNRLIYCEVLDKAEKTYAQTTYAYDAFGRRVIVQDKGETPIRTLYDGVTFDVIKQSSTFANGLFTDSNNTGIRWSPTGKPTGDRYRYISDEDAQDDNRYFYLDENTYKTASSRYRGERTQISVNGSLAAQASSEGQQYFTTDLLGSVSSVTDSYGAQKVSYSYDVFGSLVQGSFTSSADFGYLGKQNDPCSNLYNYGYRDYKPQTARFTTIDPIRDGNNWFAYVNNDPVNFIDILGLCSNNDKLEAEVNNNSIYVIISPNQEMINQLKKMQTEVLNRDDLKQGSGGPLNRTDEGITKTTSWCNQATFITARITDPELAKAMYNKDDPTGDNNTRAHHVAKNLANAVKNPTSPIREVSPFMAQTLANAGITVVGTKDVEYQGHVATVAPEYSFDNENGPMMANVGGSDKQGYTRAKSAFRGTYYEDGKVHFYVNTESAIQVMSFMEIKK